MKNIVGFLLISLLATTQVLSQESSSYFLPLIIHDMNANEKISNLRIVLERNDAGKWVPQFEIDEEQGSDGENYEIISHKFELRESIFKVSENKNNVGTFDLIVNPKNSITTNELVTTCGIFESIENPINLPIKKVAQLAKDIGKKIVKSNSQKKSNKENSETSINVTEKKPSIFGIYVLRLNNNCKFSYHGPEGYLTPQLKKDNPLSMNNMLSKDFSSLNTEVSEIPLEGIVRKSQQLPKRVIISLEVSKI